MTARVTTTGPGLRTSMGTSTRGGRAALIKWRVGLVAISGAAAVVVSLAGPPGTPAGAAAGTAQVAAAVGSGYGPAAVLARMSEAQRVGELFMAGVPATGPVSSAEAADITTYHTGSIILTGRSSAGVTATRRLTGQLQGLATDAATGGVPLLVATDQEGGEVQVLSGPGFGAMPTALSQGQESASQLRGNADTWGRQLATAGVNLNLAPVLDTVPASEASTNQPIGRYDREYGYTPAAVTAAGTAFIEGMHEAGVSVCVKHFPGLGRASGNTDTTYGVTDSVTTYSDPYLQPYASAVSSGGAQVVMVSEAIYTKIDASHQAVFSPTVLGGMLRSELRFHGVIVSDSMQAAAVSELTPAARAVDFIEAGGDLVLTTDPTAVPAMYNAVLAQAGSDPAFAAQVNAAALTVLVAKQQTGLLGGTVAAAATGTGQLTAVERAGAGSVAAFSGSGGAWTGPVSLGGRTTAQPAAAVVPGTSQLEAAVTGTDGATWVRGFAGGIATGPWTSIGGAVSAPPAIAAASGGLLAVAVRGTNHAVYVKSYKPGSGWSGWVGLGGEATDAPIGLTFSPSGDLDAFVTGTNDAVYENSRHAGSWAGWHGLGGVVAGGPAAVTVPGGPVEIFVQSSYGVACERSYSGTWSAWIRLGGILSGSPAAASPGPGASWVIADGTDGKLYQDSFAGGAWSGWNPLPFG
jgi:beta-N-acetylhexosaminidase